VGIPQALRIPSQRQEIFPNPSVERGPEMPSSPIPEVQSPPVEPAMPSTGVDPASASLTKEVTPEVINLEGSPDGGPGSPTRRGEPTFTDMAAHIPSSSAGQSSRGPGPAIRLDHLSITYPGVQSNCHVECKAKDLTGVYPYDAELMSKVGEVGCFEAGSVMLARCLALMQHHRWATEVRVDLCRRLGKLEQKNEDLIKSKAELEREVETLNQALTSRDAMLADKEAQVVHFQGLSVSVVRRN